MERASVENRVKKIISFMGNKGLAEQLEKNLKMFNDKDLEKLLEFLETGDDKLIVNFLMEKTKEFMAEVENIKQVKSKIKLTKTKKEEKNERLEEEKILEDLLNF